jgi:hypothetical protein
MIDVEPMTGTIKRTALRAGKDDHAHYRTICCPASFEDRFYDPDHPKDGDWVSDFDHQRLFGRERRPLIVRELNARRDLRRTR